MHIMQSRRDFLTTLSAAGSAGFMDARGSLADEGPPETTTVRLTSASGICVAPQYLAGNLLRADGFSDVRFVPGIKGPPGAAMIGRGEADFTTTFAASVIVRIDAGDPLTVLAGMHAGCYELCGNERIRTISDLEGKRVGVPSLGSSPHLHLTVMATYVGPRPPRPSQQLQPKPARAHPPGHTRPKPNGRQLTVLFVDPVGWSGNPRVTAALLTSLGHHEGAASVNRVAVRAPPAADCNLVPAGKEGCPEPLETPPETPCYIPQ